ncbi:uncharacterized protein LOC132697396 isoform X2 [Cylas formicarius]|uniref:uncharacterized protein LOC132697396 isoform X2 n=1 Tax=Cylas formicarius TaxID=197179 RepID=UPI00295840F4|nr:uncharacterized protein LOC132697396 isoform X2 [Cylas formicarius]
MALVMLPSDLPWWDSVKKQLTKIENTKNTTELIEIMQKIYEMCNISLDPEDDTADPEQFVGLLNFLDNDFTSEERSNFIKKTLPNITKRALMIKDFRPKGGLHFSLQQQADETELQYSFVSSLLANAFFSTFPKRTEKSHPTLQNFNFASFLKDLGSNSQKSKLKSILYYFDVLENNEESEGNIKIFRQVMSSKDWLTIDDWLECSLPLCSVQIRHDGKLERSEAENLHICFSSAKLGGNILGSGCSQECICFATIPELLITLLNVEALEDNEVVTIQGVRHICRITDPKHRATLERLEDIRELTVCCMDADDYTKLPIGQYEEDNILRELNKCLLGFQQKPISKKQELPNPVVTYNHRRRRLSPIGESFNSIHSDVVKPDIPLITQDTCSTRANSMLSLDEDGRHNTLGVQKIIEKSTLRKNQCCADTLVNNRRGRFIVLGSSGECLPVVRNPLRTQKSTQSALASSSEEEFYSAKSSLDNDSEEENYHKRYSIDLETLESRQTFAQRLREAMKDKPPYQSESSSDESDYAIGISLAGSEVADYDIKIRRQNSTGFALGEDDDEMIHLSGKEKQLVDKFDNNQSSLSRKSSECSFTTEYSSELEEVYEQFTHWLENPILQIETGTKKQLDARELAVVRFAGSLLKRTLSESFAGVPVPMAETCDLFSRKITNSAPGKSKLVLSAKSLSLELARQKHRLASQLNLQEVSPIKNPNNRKCNALNMSGLNKCNKAWFITCMQNDIVQTLEDVIVPLVIEKKVSQISQKSTNGLRPVSSGNWGCGSSRKGDVQLKVVIQWMAASVAGAPSLIYYTYKHPQLAKLDTVCRILIDRKWTVKELAEVTLKYSNHVLRGKQLSGTLFEDLIGIDKTDI